MEDSNEGLEKAKQFSLLHPMAMGGIIGGDGYTFQERYIVCHIPQWLSDSQFVRFMNEGTGDVDIAYLKGSDHFYDHIQVKDHQVTPSEFKEVINSFVKIDQGTGKAYRKFILAAPALSKEIKSLLDALKRYQGGEEFYSKDDKINILKSTKDDLSDKIIKLDLGGHSDFILTKLAFDIGKLDFNDNEICRQIFTSSLIDHPNYKSYFQDLIRPVYSRLIEEVTAHRGKPLEHNTIHEIIKSTLTAPPKRIQDNVLHVHNWTYEKYEPEATIELDWSQYFDRSSRTVPDSTIWDSELIPQFNNIRQKLAKSTTNRHIIFRGKCALSTGFALGMAFPEIGNWTIELQQYRNTWRSDAHKLKEYKLQHDVVDPASLSISTESDEMAVVFNITGQAIDEVTNYFKTNNIAINKLVFIYPSNTPGNLSIQDDSEAVTLASISKDIIKEMISRYKSKKTHLFYFGPFGLAIFLGQKLTSVGRIQLYEFQDPGYKASCLIRT